MEQTARYSAISARAPWVWEGDHGDAGGVPSASREMSEPLSAILCPSDGNAKTPGYNNGGRTSIVSCHGDVIDANNWPQGERDGVVGLINYLDDYWRRCADVSKRGMFAP